MQAVGRMENVAVRPGGGPDVSVVMPLYNSSKYLDESVQSVRFQSYQNWELILVDDASSDDTLERAHAWAQQDSRIRIIACPTNSGAGRCRNLGIESAEGRYIAFLDSDDFWDKEKLTHQLSEMARRAAGFSYTDYAIRFEDRQRTKIYQPPEALTYRDLLRHCAIGCSTVIYDTKVFGKRFFPGIRKRQDFALWLAMLKDIDRAYKCGPALTTYRVRSGSISANKLKATLFTWNIYRQHEKLGVVPSLYYLMRHSLAATRKRL